eukprot:TRINITY_DN2329_c0_g2_i1.p1 TRINITY_DN2329_c0_g2~~TRINITY_DN2329_c0_g2_i1.p1  ORF type:complete len:219 (-),score=68.12 TRINITY_DN2329_c0_g2_i1:206-862(-)
MIATNLNYIQNCIRNKSETCQLVAVSKYQPVEKLEEAYNAGNRLFGENYVQELIEKAEILPKDIEWHFIGHLQSNKVSKICAIENLTIHTVDSSKLCRKLNNAWNFNKKLSIFLQINTSLEETKSGINPNIEEILPIVDEIINNCPNLEFKGLMTIGDPGNNECFVVLKDLANQIEKNISKNCELSMGMSGDFIKAIENGSDYVRVGSAIFGDRPPKN